MNHNYVFLNVNITVPNLLQLDFFSNYWIVTHLILHAVIFFVLFQNMAGHRSNYGKRSHSQSDYSESGGIKEEIHQFSIGSDDTVYRYLCPGKKIGSIIGREGILSSN